MYMYVSSFVPGQYNSTLLPDTGLNFATQLRIHTDFDTMQYFVFHDVALYAAVARQRAAIHQV